MKNLLYSLFVLFGFSLVANAQVKVGSNPTTINTNSLLEMESSSKGLLFPRVALTSTTSAAPLSAHVQGMTVYNTATAGDVKPGIYVNDGTAWTKLVVPSETGGIGGSSGSTGVITLLPGQSTFFYHVIPVSTANATKLSNVIPTTVPSFEGITVDVQKSDNNYYRPQFINKSGSSITFSFCSRATVNYKVSNVNTVLANNAAVDVDGDGIMFWSTSNAETQTADVIIAGKWYRIEWFCLIPPTDNTNHHIRIAITRLT